ncbi:MAG: CoA pyrophosphatase [Flavobacteriia bacterium]|nr:CoA pyrophosphatase [Flavobacteriia bacterium]
MFIGNKINKIKNILNNDLPGFKAHEEFYPLKNRKYKPDTSTFQNAAICMILTNNLENITELLFIKRPTYDGHHSGQIAFPGGKKEESDLSLFDTALRECVEETNIQLENTQLIGAMSEVFIPVSNFLVQPYLFYLPNITDTIIPDFHEVEDLFYIPINEFLKQENRTNETVITHQNQEISVPCFKINNRIIWGATGLMVNELKFILQQL